MEVYELSLPIKNPFVKDYVQNEGQMDHFFDYCIHDEDVFEKRLKDVKVRTYKRDELAQYLRNYHRKFPQCEATIHNIERLKQKDAVVVVGGQQAGLLTGPLYTIHKIISIISLAKEQENKLGVPVIPVFWIAGEDHDFEEINHVHVLNKNQVKKKSIRQIPIQKSMVSDIRLDKKACMAWVHEVFQHFGETNYTNDLLRKIDDFIQNSYSYVDFFEYIVMDLFSDSGLVLINAASPELREIEKEYFYHLLKGHREIYDSVMKQQQSMRELGYEPIIEMKENSVNIFFHYDQERFLLKKEDEATFSIPEHGLTVGAEELEKILSDSPERFSNNVVTRPLMQEMLLPTLAFIAGPGEIVYWGELREAFCSCRLKMPPVVPRINITFMERHIESDLNELELSLEEVWGKGVHSLSEDWLAKQQPVNIQPFVEEAKEQVEQIHRSLREKALEIDKSLKPLLEKNAFFIENQLSFVEKAVRKRVQEKYENELNKFRRIEQSLLPNGAPQERIWNVFYYINKYGPEFVKNLQHQTYSCNGKHKVVKI
ncbi:bacillithiol biosynthesis cysteine-adding enzyme BshC [Bacillus kexueae]|uniref:bacillithiol biosynthesis cysteine-adding enzyme BshC n=1 Tax=Aeribacillus kexueae TaxID=2078952 RepID=UPI001FAF87D9|nr:bacillithiol biosynthesis cysteine-adding enzyme BshC [Bacillus kexueae]